MSVLRGAPALCVCARLCAVLCACSSRLLAAAAEKVSPRMRPSPFTWKLRCAPARSRSFEARWPSWRASGASCLPAKPEAGEQARVWRRRCQCSPSHRGLDCGGLPGSFRSCAARFTHPILETAEIPLDRRKLRRSGDGAPAEARSKLPARLPPRAAPRSPELAERREGRSPSQNTQERLRPLVLGRGARPPTLEQIASASSSSGCLNSYPRSSARRGITRWPPRSTLPELSAVHQVQGSPGTGTTAGRPKRLAQRLREHLVGHRIRRGRVDDAADLLVVERPEQDADLVVDVDPGDVLVAAGERAADAQLERGQQRAEEAAARVEHVAGADDRPGARRSPSTSCAAFSHSRTTSASKPSPGSLDSSTIASPRSP